MSKSLVYCFLIALVFTFICSCEKGVHQDAQGKYHGSGNVVSYYESGQRLRCDSFDQGVLTTSIWYSPKGKEVFRTDWGVNGEGFEYYLYESGAFSGLTFMVGSVAGMIQYEPVGDEGFGYDPVFYLPSFGQSMAQISLADKNRISHRSDAARKAVAFLSDQLSAISGQR